VEIEITKSGFQGIHYELGNPPTARLICPTFMSVPVILESDRDAEFKIYTDDGVKCLFTGHISIEGTPVGDGFQVLNLEGHSSQLNELPFPHGKCVKGRITAKTANLQTTWTTGLTADELVGHAVEAKSKDEVVEESCPLVAAAEYEDGVNTLTLKTQLRVGIDTATRYHSAFQFSSTIPPGATITDARMICIATGDVVIKGSLDVTGKLSAHPLEDLMATGDTRPNQEAANNWTDNDRRVFDRIIATDWMITFPEGDNTSLIAQIQAFVDHALYDVGDSFILFLEASDESQAVNCRGTIERYSVRFNVKYTVPADTRLFYITSNLAASIDGMIPDWTSVGGTVDEDEATLCPPVWKVLRDLIDSWGAQTYKLSHDANSIVETPVFITQARIGQKVMEVLRTAEGSLPFATDDLLKSAWKVQTDPPYAPGDEYTLGGVEDTECGRFYIAQTLVHSGTEHDVRNKWGGIWIEKVGANPKDIYRRYDAQAVPLTIRYKAWVKADSQSATAASVFVCNTDGGVMNNLNLFVVEAVLGTLSFEQSNGVGAPGAVDNDVHTPAGVEFDVRWELTASAAKVYVNNMLVHTWTDDNSNSEYLRWWAWSVAGQTSRVFIWDLVIDSATNYWTNAEYSKREIVHYEDQDGKYHWKPLTDAYATVLDATPGSGNVSKITATIGLLYKFVTVFGNHAYGAHYTVTTDEDVTYPRTHVVVMDELTTVEDCKRAAEAEAHKKFREGRKVHIITTEADHADLFIAMGCRVTWNGSTMRYLTEIMDLSQPDGFGTPIIKQITAGRLET
jgi:hypothetical protein